MYNDGAMLVEVTDNFLPDYQFKIIEDILLGNSFAWYFNSRSIKANSFPQYTHTFYDNRSPWNGIGSEWYPIIEPLLLKLKVQKLYRVKANLNPKTFFHRNTGWHTDVPDDIPIKTSVYYLDTNNGFTKFKKGSKIKSVSNRMVIFDSNLQHAGFTTTNKQRRVVLNFNYV